MVLEGPHLCQAQGPLSAEDGETSGTSGATRGGQLIAALCTFLFLSLFLIDDCTSCWSGNAMSGPSTWPSVHRSYSRNHPGPACAHTRYCLLQPPSPSLFTASGSVWRPVPSSGVLGTLGSPGWPDGSVGQLEPHPSTCAASVPEATCCAHTVSPAAPHLALCPAPGQMEPCEPLGGV
jgi:hypothetical protein